MRRVRSAVLLICASTVALHTPAEIAQDAQASYWNGKNRAEILSLLGEPTKAKKSADGSEVLTYKLVRLREGGVPPQGTMVLSLPEIGLVGQVLASVHPGVKESVEVEPSGLDEDGALVPGGQRTTQTAATSWSREKGLEGYDNPENGDALLGTVKIRFHLDAAGRVDEWSMTPKKKGG